MLRTRRRRQKVRLIAGMVLGVYSVVASGMPIPLATELSSLLIRYPCEETACGCSSAEKCWRSCCCHTLEEKLAWAQKNGIAVPDFIAKQAGQIIAKQGGRQLSCCAHADAKLKKCGETADSQADDQGAERQTVLLAMVNLCSGNPFGLPGIVPALVLPSDIVLDEKASTSMCIYTDSFLSGGLLPPPTPPPEWC